MKKATASILCLLFLMLPLRARNSVSHYATAGISAAVAAQSLSSDWSFKQMALGPQAGLSAGYALQYNHLLFHTRIGIGYRFLSGALSDYQDETPSIDSQNDPFILITDYKHVHTNQRALQLSLPVLLGGQWNKFYFLLGPQFAFHTLQQNKLKADITYLADYGVFCIPFSDMPNHGLITEHTANQWTPANHCLTMGATLELGAIVAQNWRIAFVANIPLWKSLILNSQPSTLNSQPSTLNSQPSTLNSQFSTLNSQPSTLNSQFSILNSPITLGVHVAYWFKFPKRYPCHCIKY